MTNFIKRLFSSAAKADSEEAGRARITVQDVPDVIFAVGDVHGCLDELQRLESQFTHASPQSADRLIVMLGDYVDRGEDPASVIEHLMQPAPSGMARICLCGNHEQLMLDAYETGTDIDRWLALGGLETMISYGADHLSLNEATGDARRLQQIMQSHIPPEHVAFLKELPVAVLTPTHVFVHAGVRSGQSLADQDDDDLMWSRANYETVPHDLGLCIVHGHTPVDTPINNSQHINVDTGAYMSGHLTAAVIAKTGGISFLST